MLCCGGRVLEERTKIIGFLELFTDTIMATLAVQMAIEKETFRGVPRRL
jgi:hypothetical protein